MTLQIDRICLILSRGASTPITYWLDLDLAEVVGWMKAASSLMKDNG